MIKKIIRMACFITYYGFVRWLPSSSRPLVGGASRWLRYQVCRHLFLSCAKNVNIEHGADFGGGGKIAIDENSGIGLNCRISYDVVIGKNVMMGPEVIILNENHKFNDTYIPMIQQGGQEQSPVEIGDDVWIGTRVIILPGVHVGKGVVIGAGSVVTRDVQPYEIVAGNPARVIRNRKQSAGAPGDR